MFERVTPTPSEQLIAGLKQMLEMLVLVTGQGAAQVLDKQHGKSFADQTLYT